MRKLIRRTAILALGVLLLAAPSCTGNAVDDANTAHVLLELLTMQAQPVTAQADQNNPGSCIFQVPEWTAEMANQPKNELAITSPFNDIVMLDVTVNADWGALGTFQDVIGLAATVPAASTQSVKFFPVSSLPAGLVGGESAALSMLFRGTTISGDGVSVSAGAQLVVNACQ